MNYILVTLRKLSLANKLITIILSAVCFLPAIISDLYPGFIFHNPALAATSETSISKKIANQSGKESPIAAPAITAKGDYGRLPEHFIVNRGRADEKIVICMEGEKLDRGKKEKSDIIDEVLAAKDKPKEYPHLVPLEKGLSDKLDVVNASTPPASLCEPKITGGFMTTVIGPGELSFSWKVSCDPLGACLEVMLDGEHLSKISGEIDWQVTTLKIPAGHHTLIWQYKKNWDKGFGADCGWLDQVEFSPHDANNMKVCSH
jgi:hypothetical protein